MEEDELGPKTVFTIKESEIPKGITQCREHSWRKLAENELKCTKCPTAVIVNEETLKELYGG
jgi:hypothetical protein